MSPSNAITESATAGDDPTTLAASQHRLTASRPHTTNRKCSLLLALGLTIEG